MPEFSTGYRDRVAGTSKSILSNGTFDSNTTSWTAQDSTLASVAGGQDGNALQVAESGGTNVGKAYHDVTTVVGRVYKGSYYFKKGTSDFGRFMIGTTSVEDSLYDSGQLNDANWTQREFVFIATETTTRLTCQTEDTTATENSLFDTIILDPLFDGIRDIFNGFLLTVYSGSRPLTADASSAGTKLIVFSLNATGNGLTLDDSVAGVISKPDGETWSGEALADGNSAWFRMHLKDEDPDVASTEFARIDGTIAPSGADLEMAVTAVQATAVQTLSSFSLEVPNA